jgi:ComF family protein
MAETHHSFVCETCRLDPPAFEFARSAGFYREPVDRMIMDFKYRKSTWLCEDLVDLLEGAVRAKLAFHDIDVVMPVPLHQNRLRERGYNQSAILARSLAKRINRRVDEASLVRTRDTEHQARLSGDARRKNLKDAFAVTSPALVRGRLVLLIDDIMTSGATLSHCARPLLDAGAAGVWCATVARAVLTGASNGDA